MTVLLKTRLYPPPIPPGLVPRAHLFARLDSALHKKLTLVSAPPGFGKTTLLSSWIQERHIPAAWLTLDKDTNQPEIFWSYFIAALQTIHPGLGESGQDALSLDPRLHLNDLLTALLNELGEIQDKDSFLLILDDLQQVEATAILDGLFIFIENLPKIIHLILATRLDPPWPLARLRGQGQLNELRVDDLRFSLDETTAFLQSTLGQSLPLDEIIALDERTQGWAVGLQMAALSMQTCPDKSEFIRLFSGSHRFILDYLLEEVLDRQPADIREFLLKTSLLERLTGPLCDAVLQIEGSQGVLERLAHANLFLSPLDAEKRWYRYHPLFADLLGGYLVHTYPDQVTHLHRRASQWFASLGLLPEAARHAFLSNDLDAVAQLVEDHALPIITTFSEHLPRLVEWLNALPQNLVQQRPSLGVARAWLLAYSGDLNSAEAVIQHVDDLVARLPDDLANQGLTRSALAGYLAAIRGYERFIRADLVSAASCMEQALVQLPPDHTSARLFSSVILGSTRGMLGDLPGGIRILESVMSTGPDLRSAMLVLMVLDELAGLQLLTGRLTTVTVTCQQAIQRANDYERLVGISPPGIAFAYARLAFVQREQDDLESALRTAQQALKISRAWGQKDSLSTSSLYLSLVLQAAGQAQSALDLVSQARGYAHQLSPALFASATAYEAKLHAMCGDVPFLLRWAEHSGLSPNSDTSLAQARPLLVFARFLLLQNRLGDCLALLERFLTFAQSTGAMLYEIEALLLQAQAFRAQGRVDQALSSLVRALHLAEPEGYVRIFTDEGPALRDLLDRAAVGAPTNAYAACLHARLTPLPPQSIDKLAPTAGLAAGRGAALTRREQEILLLLATPLTIRSIAGELCISVSTLRTHLRNIYDKLAVHSRLQAAAFARGLQDQE